MQVSLFIVIFLENLPLGRLWYTLNVNKVHVKGWKFHLLKESIKKHCYAKSQECGCCVGLTATVPLLQMITLPFCPESPRYLLLSKDENEKAKKGKIVLYGSQAKAIQLFTPCKYDSYFLSSRLIHRWLYLLRVNKGEKVTIKYELFNIISLQVHDSNILS